MLQLDSPLECMPKDFHLKIQLSLLELRMIKASYHQCKNKDSILDQFNERIIIAFNLYLLQTWHCGTFVPMWLDMQGAGMPAAGEMVDARACGTLWNKCCRVDLPVSILNCGAFFVYHLQAVTACLSRYCAEAPTLPFGSAHIANT